MRAKLVSREGLRVHAQAIGLGKYLMMGRGEEASGGRERASALADAYEALIGAMYLDSDYVTVRRIVLTESRDYVEDLHLDMTDANPKGRLQEILQSISPESPTYPIIDQSGPEHEKRFVARIVWERASVGRRRKAAAKRGGGSRRRALRSLARTLESPGWRFRRADSRTTAKPTPWKSPTKNSPISRR